MSVRTSISTESCNFHLKFLQLSPEFCIADVGCGSLSIPEEDD